MMYLLSSILKNNLGTKTSHHDLNLIVGYRRATLTLTKGSKNVS